MSGIVDLLSSGHVRYPLINKCFIRRNKSFSHAKNTFGHEQCLKCCIIYSKINMFPITEKTLFVGSALSFSWTSKCSLSRCVLYGSYTISFSVNRFMRDAPLNWAILKTTKCILMTLRTTYFGEKYEKIFLNYECILDLSGTRGIYSMHWFNQ